MTSKANALLNVCFKYSRVLFISWMVILLCVLVFYMETGKNYASNARILVSMGSEAQGKAAYLDGKNLVLTQREEAIYDEQQILQSHEVALQTAKWILGDPTDFPSPPELASRIDEARKYFTGEKPEPTLTLRAVHAIQQGISKLSSKPKSRDSEEEDLARSISKNLGVNAIFNSDALDATFKYRDPRVAQTVLTLILAAYINRHIDVFQDAGEQKLLKSQLDLSVNQYQDRLSQLSAYMVAHHVYTGDVQIDSMLDQHQKLDQAYSEALADSDAQAARLSLLNSLDHSMDQYEQYSSTEARNKELENLSTKLDDELVQEQNVLNLHPKGSRAYQDEQARLDRLRELIKDKPAQVIDMTEKRRTEASQLVESDIVDATSVQRADQARIQSLRLQRDRIASQMNDYTNNVGGFNLLQLQIAFAKQKSEQLGQAYVNSQLKSLTSENSITDVSIVDPPSWDTHVASPKSSIVGLATLGLLLSGSIAILLACAALDDTFIDGAAVAEALQTPVTAVFPLAIASSDFDRSPYLLSGRNELEFARIYQAVRHEAPEGRIILLASSEGAGASLVGYEMSRFFSRMSGRKSALINCTAHPVDISSAAAAAPDSPSILPWPDPPSNTQGAEAHALSSVASWRQQFSYTVIAADAENVPVNLLSASNVIDSSFLLLEANKTKRSTAHQELELLRSCGFPHIGLILNKFRSFTPYWIERFV